MSEPMVTIPVSMAVMPAHEDEGRPCYGAKIPGYVHVVDPTHWHCNRCGWIAVIA